MIREIRGCFDPFFMRRRERRRPVINCSAGNRQGTLKKWLPAIDSVRNCA